MQEEFSHTLLHKQNVFDRFHNQLKKQQSQQEEVVAAKLQARQPSPPPLIPPHQQKETLGINAAVQDVLGKINAIEIGGGAQPRPPAPVFHQQNFQQQQ